jgi:DNA polymerase-3 subunit gamma/tau
MVAPPAAPTAPALSPDAPWEQQVEALGLEGMTRELARHSALAEEKPGAIRLALDSKARHLLNEDRRAAVERALVRLRGHALRLLIEIGSATEAMSPVAVREQKLVDRQRDAEAAIANDPVVRSFKEAFGATVRPGSITPIGEP